MAGRLEGKIAVITGGASGTRERGALLARRWLSPHHQRLQTDRDRDREPRTRPASAFKYTLSITEPLRPIWCARWRPSPQFDRLDIWGEDAGVGGAIVAAADGRAAGTTPSPVLSVLALHPRLMSIGYILHDEADRGKGYASQALRLLTALLFDQRPACHRIQLLIDVDNTPSWRLAEACGYTREAFCAARASTSTRPRTASSTARPSDRDHGPYIPGPQNGQPA